MSTKNRKKGFERFWGGKNDMLFFFLNMNDKVLTIWNRAEEDLKKEER